MVGIALGRSSEGLKLSTANWSSSGAFSVLEYQLVTHSFKDLHFPLLCLPRIVCKPQAGLSRGSEKSGPPKTCSREKQISAGIHPCNWDWLRNLKSVAPTFSWCVLTFPLVLQKQPAHPWKLKRFSWLHIFEVWNGFNLVAFMGSTSYFRYHDICSQKPWYLNFVTKYWGLTLLKESFLPGQRKITTGGCAPVLTCVHGCWEKTWYSRIWQDRILQNISGDGKVWHGKTWYDRERCYIVRYGKMRYNTAGCGKKVGVPKLIGFVMQWFCLVQWDSTRTGSGCDKYIDIWWKSGMRNLSGAKWRARQNVAPSLVPCGRPALNGARMDQAICWGRASFG